MLGGTKFQYHQQNLKYLLSTNHSMFQYNITIKILTKDKIKIN